ncbi:MAG: hypothetical protein ACYCQJ_07000 [Nitrososphaerales archaeon]
MIPKEEGELTWYWKYIVEKIGRILHQFAYSYNLMRPHETKYVPSEKVAGISRLVANM